MNIIIDFFCRQELLKWNGWGYKDSKFTVKENSDLISFIGNRYEIGDMDLPYFTEWVKSRFNISVSNMGTVQNQAKPLPKPEDYPLPIVNNGMQYLLKLIKFINSHHMKKANKSIIYRVKMGNFLNYE